MITECNVKIVAGVIKGLGMDEPGLLSRPPSGLWYW
jgi:hypothetical protein